MGGYRAKVTKHYEVVAATSGALHPKTDAGGTSEGGVERTSGADGGSAVQPPGLSLCLLTTPEISSTGPVRGRGFCPGSHRPHARVPLVVWA